MKHTKTNVFTTIAGVIRKYKKKYCLASQEKLIELVGSFYGVRIKRRQLNYHLADLRKMGYIKTIRRTKRRSDGTLCLQTSATCITPAGYYALWKMGCEWAKKMYDKLVKKYCPKIARAIAAANDIDMEELMRRRALAKEIIKTPAFRKAFGLDDDDRRFVPNF